MNGISNLLGTPLAQAIGWALLHLLWQGLLVAAILAATLALLARQSANARYLASCGALVLLVVLGAATAYRSYDGSGELGVGSGREVSVSPVPAPASGSDGNAESAISQNPPPTPHSPLTSLASFAKSHLPQIVLVWLTGVLLLSVRLLFGWLRAHAIAKRNASDAAPEWQRIAARLANALNLRRAVQLLESAAVEVPTVIGWLRPVVLLPAATLTGLSTEQMEMILAHELAHIRRNDFFVNLMQAVVETLLFYHPAVWWISNRIRVEREHCCDDVAVSVSGNALVYARALTRLEELRIEDTQAFVAANGGSLIGRIRRLAGARVESPNAPSRFVAGAALLTVLLALIIAPSLPLRGEQQKADPPAPKPKAAQTTVDVKASEEGQASDANDEADVSDEADDPMPVVAPRPAMAGVRDGIASGIEGGIASGIAGGIADGVIDGIVANVAPVIAVPAVPRMRPAIAIAPPSRMAIAAPRAAWRMAVLDQLDAPEPPEAPLAPAVWNVRKNRRHIGEGGKLTVDDLIELRSSGVTPAYIDSMRSAGLGELSLDDIAEMRAVGVTPEYIRSLRDAGVKFDNVRHITELRAIGVTGDYIAQMRAAGYANLTSKELASLRAMNVTPAYVKQLSEAGYKNVTTRELIELRAQNISPEFIKSLNDAGYTNLSVKDLVRMAAMGVNAEFIRDLAKYKVK
jgi:beta-lactamase regulating signal transducer with metallopeptidase domain